MLSFYRERCLSIGDTCKVYRNLNNRKFSIVATKGIHKGKVVAHADCVLLKNVSFKISEASRQRALRDNTRNVHAYSIGEIQPLINHCQLTTFDEITYHPFDLPYFYKKSDKSEITKCSLFYLNNGKAFAEKQLEIL